MKQEELITLIDKLDNSSLAFLNYETKDVKVTLSKEMPKETPVYYAHSEDNKPVQQAKQEEVVTPSVQLEVPTESTEAPEEDGVYITSPMVGVVYLQPSPDSDPYVKVGDTVNEGDTVVIIEAMKLMNEIHSNHTGTVAEILVENETVVEYGQPIIRIK